MEVDMELADEDPTPRLIKELKVGQIQLVTVVEQLGPKLTSTDVDKRVNGVQTLTKILSSLETDFLTVSQLMFISTFYEDRLKDNHNVIPTVLEGILALINMKNLPNDSPSKLLKAIFCNVSCQQQLRTDRYVIYSIIQTLAINHTDDIRTMGVDLTLGLMCAMDGERDPRNLLFLFSILPSILKIVNLGHVEEEMFEVMACYFPVDFNTPQDDAKAITRNDLAERLSLCLCAVSAFDTFCIQLLLEKLDSDLRIAKMDSLKLLKQSCSTFKAKSFEPHLHAIWQALQKEISSDTDPEIKQVAHEALSELINRLCSDESSSSISNSFLKEVTTTIQCLLVDAKTKLKIESLFQVYSTIANSSDISCIFIIKIIHPVLINQFNSTTNDVMKYLILEFFKQTYMTCKHWDLLNKVSDDFKPIIEISINATKLSNIDLKLSGLKAITVMSETVTMSEAMIVQDILNYNINHENMDNIIESSKLCLLSLAKQYPENYKSFIVELCILDSVKNNKTLLKRRINILCTIFSINHYTKVIIDNFYNFINSDIEIASCILETLSSIMKNKDIFTDEKLQYIQVNFNIIEFLLGWTNKDIRDDKHILCHVCDVIVSVMKSQTGETQKKLYSELLPSYLENLLKGDVWLVVLMEALLNSSKIDIRIDKLDKILEAAYDTSVKNSDNFIQTRACRLIANALNKYIQDIPQYYEDMKDNFALLVENNDLDEIIYLNSIALTSWITKSLLLNGHIDASHWLSKLTQLLKCEKWGQHAAKGFQLIMTDDEHSLNRCCHCKVNFLYKQKVFQLFLQFVSIQDDFNNNCSEPFFQACTYIVQSIPKSVLLMELSKISSIIIDCLNFDEPNILLPILDIFSFLIQNNKLSFGIQTLLPRCLRLCGFSNVRVRVASLQCIFDIASNYSTPELLPYKPDVVLALGKYLDDPKRLVRSVAVKSRTRWYLVGSPGEDKAK